MPQGVPAQPQGCNPAMEVTASYYNPELLYLVCIPMMVISPVAPGTVPCMYAACLKKPRSEDDDPQRPTCPTLDTSRHQIPNGLDFRLCLVRGRSPPRGALSTSMPGSSKHLGHLKPSHPLGGAVYVHIPITYIHLHITYIYIFIFIHIMALKRRA